MSAHIAHEAVGIGVRAQDRTGWCWCWCRRKLQGELGLVVGRDLHVHDKSGHVHDHGRVLRTCEVDGIVGFELGIQHRVRVDLRARALLLRWAVRPGLLSARGGGLGLGLFVLAVFGRIAVLVGTTRANVAHSRLADQSSQTALGPGPHTQVYWRHPSGRSDPRTVPERNRQLMIITVTRLSWRSNSVVLFY